MDVTYELGVPGRAENAIWADVDEDGDLDLVTSERRDQDRDDAFMQTPVFEGKSGPFGP